MGNVGGWCRGGGRCDEVMGIMHSTIGFCFSSTTLLQDHHSRAMCCTYEIEQRHRLTGRRLHIKYTRNDADERKRCVYCGGCAGLEVQRWCIVEFEVGMPLAGEEEI